jgi:hypothetical protein
VSARAGLHAWVQGPWDRDAYSIYVVQYPPEHEGNHGYLLCGDGIWRRYEEYEVLDAGDRTPTVVLEGYEIDRRSGDPGHLLRTRVDALSYGVAGAIRDAVAGDECAPLLVKQALA